MNLRTRLLKQPIYSYLIGTNITIYLAWKSQIISKQFLLNNFTLTPYNKKRIYPLITHSFSHNSLSHLLLNCAPLFIFGRQLELAIGSYKLLKLYLSGALLSGLFLCTHKQNINDKYRVCLGASGATYCLVTYYTFMMPARQALLIITLVLPSTLFTDTGIHRGHLGGVLAGALSFIIQARLFRRLTKL